MDRKELLSKRILKHKEVVSETKEFLYTFLDDKSFIEADALLLSSEKNSFAGESVICGQGTIGGKTVFVVAQNSKVLQGGVAKEHAEKFCNALKMAYMTRMPIITVLDSMGGRVDTGVEVLNAYAEILSNAHKLSGEVPHICIVKGAALGSMSVFAGLCDVVYFLKDGVASLSSPSVLLAKEEVNKKEQEVFGKAVHSEKTGICTFIVEEAELPAHLARLVRYLPINSHTGTDIEDVSEEDLNKALPKNIESQDVFGKISQIFDKGSFFEFFPLFGKGIVCGLAKLAGITVAVVANNSKVNQGRVCKNTANKITKFVSFCDAFNIPIINIVDTMGAVEEIDMEQRGLSLDVTRLFSTYLRTSVPRISLITHNAVGIGFNLFASKALGVDNVLAWANAYVAPVAKEIGGIVCYQKEIESAEDVLAAREVACQKYEIFDADPVKAAEKGVVDNVILPRQTRVYLISSLQTLNFKHKDVSAKKHVVSVL